MEKTLYAQVISSNKDKKRIHDFKIDDDILSILEGVMTKEFRELRAMNVLRKNNKPYSLGRLLRLAHDQGKITITFNYENNKD